MTTAQSPLHMLTQQADRIANTLKQIERGETVALDPGGKMAASRSKPTVTFGVFMDDKFIKITMPWSIIRECSKSGLAEYVLMQMQETRKQ